ncbi:MAG: P-II family nitrogen regulator [Pseudomonadota bacterium]
MSNHLLYFLDSQTLATDQLMFSIVATIKPFKLDDVREALADLGVGGMTVTEVLRQTPPQRTGRRFSDAQSGPVDLSPHINIQVVVPDHLVESVIEAICHHGSSGKLDNGLVTVSRVESVVRVRTGDRDDDALST